MKIHRFSTLLIAALLAGLAINFIGCRSVGTVEPAEKTGTPTTIADKRVITDDSLQRKIAVLGVDERMLDNGFLQVQVRLASQIQRTQGLNYVFEWYDADGMLITSPSAVWRHRRILGKETVALQETAPSPQAVDFIFKMQES